MIYHRNSGSDSFLAEINEFEGALVYCCGWDTVSVSVSAAKFVCVQDLVVIHVQDAVMHCQTSDLWLTFW